MTFFEKVVLLSCSEHGTEKKMLSPPERIESKPFGFCHALEKMMQHLTLSHLVSKPKIYHPLYSISSKLMKYL